MKFVAIVSTNFKPLHQSQFTAIYGQTLRGDQAEIGVLEIKRFASL